MLKFFENSWSMFTPPKNLIYHLWERDYRPTFAQEKKTHDKERQQKCLQIIKDKVFGNEQFLREMKLQRGVDLVESTATAFAQNGGLDSNFF